MAGVIITPMSELLDPEDFVITRRRKKYKFARFHNAANCYELDQWQPRSVDIIELGAGTGLFALELAARHPELEVVAVDVKADRLQRGAYLALDRGITNISFVRARADQVGELVPESSVQAIWLTFADPFPRSRSASRRMSHPTYLERYAAALAPGGKFLLKHDNLEFFQWSLEQLVAAGWQIDELSFDLHESDLHDDYKILTTYEQRWLSQGLTTHFVRATPASGAPS